MAVMTGHLNLLSWLQEQDHDVWLYLYENYLVHVMNHKKTLSEVHRPLHFKKMFKNLQVENTYDSHYESMSYARYVGGKFDISLLGSRVKSLDKQQNNYWVVGLKLKEPDSYNWINENKPTALKLDRWSKDDLIEKCKEYDIHYRKSWNKDKIIKALMNHPDN